MVDGFDDDDAEAAAVARWLRRAHRPGRPWSHLAVLARTNARLDPIARALERAGIPHRLGGDAKEAATARRALAELRRAPKTRHLRSALAELVMTGQARADEETRASGCEGPVSERGLPRALAQLADEHALEFPDATVGEFLDWVVAGGDANMELDTDRRGRAVHLPPRQGTRVAGRGRGRSRGRHGAHRLRHDPAGHRRRDDGFSTWRSPGPRTSCGARGRGTRRAGDRTWRCDPSPLLAAVAEASRDIAVVPDTHRLSARIASLRTMLPERSGRAS